MGSVTGQTRERSRAGFDSQFFIPSRRVGSEICAVE